MRKMGPVEKWLIIRDFARELQERSTNNEATKQQPKKKSVKRKRRRIK